MDAVNPQAPAWPTATGIGHDRSMIRSSRGLLARGLAGAAVALLAALATERAHGQVPRAQPVYPSSQSGAISNGAAQPAERMTAVDPDKKLSAGDQLTVEILEGREGGVARIVTAAGELDVPPLGHVKVSGRTSTEAANEIRQLLEKDYYYHATVRVSIDRVSPVQVRAGVIYLSGEVRMLGPQEIIAGETLTLSNAILKAGGLAGFGDPKKVKLMRQKNGATETTVVNYKALIEQGDVKSDPVLQDGDRIFVPKKIFNF